MLRIDVTLDGKDYTFRTNNSGDYLFIGVSENKQISTESGFNSLSRMKRAIREHLKYRWEMEHFDEPMPRIKYDVPSYMDFME